MRPPEIAGRKVLMITPHFPPDSSAGTHRVRLLAPYLERYGWTPTVLTVDSGSYEGRPDPDLEALVPASLRVERVKAISSRLTRAFGFGDLGLRSLPALYSAASDLLSRETYDLLFITIYPAYGALLGPLLKRRFAIPFVLDYQDPWVGAWGESVGAGAGGAVDMKSRASRRIATLLEPRVLESADAITAVSDGTIDGITMRVPIARRIPASTIPIGGDAQDFEGIRQSGRKNSIFDPSDGLFHLVYVGTLLPKGIEVLQAFLTALAHVRTNRADLYNKLRVHFVGTSNQRTGVESPLVMGHAKAIGVADIVKEHPARVDYSEAMRIQLQASAILLMGSSEHHYTSSKLYPAMLADRPLLGLYHRQSSASEIMLARSCGSVKLVQFGDQDPPAQHVEDISTALASIMESGVGESRGDLAGAAESEFSAQQLAGVLVDLFDRVVKRGPKVSS